VNTLKKELDAAAGAYLLRVLDESYGSITEAAQAAGISRQYMHKLMAKHGIKMEKAITCGHEKKPA
jgi:transcriptional regulator of acetoin/glycerol metabolism